MQAKKNPQPSVTQGEFGAVISAEEGISRGGRRNAVIQGWQQRRADAFLARTRLAGAKHRRAQLNTLRRLQSMRDAAKRRVYPLVLKIGAA